MGFLALLGLENVSEKKCCKIFCSTVDTKGDFYMIQCSRHGEGRTTAQRHEASLLFDNLVDAQCQSVQDYDLDSVGRLRATDVVSVFSSFFKWLSNPSFDSVSKHQLKGLILAQNECWRRGLGMQVERDVFPACRRYGKRRKGE